MGGGGGVGSGGGGGGVGLGGQGGWERRSEAFVNIPKKKFFFFFGGGGGGGGGGRVGGSFVRIQKKKLRVGGWVRVGWGLGVRSGVGVGEVG